MEMKNYSRELRVAKNIALQTWQIIVPFYDRSVAVEIKKDGTPVTEADKRANEYITGSLQKEFPEDSIVSEEGQTVFAGNRTWYIDPIDGTKGFIKRNAHFAIHIGLCEDRIPVMGVVYWPSVGDMYSGIVGIGAYRENNRGILELKLDNIANRGLIASTNGDFPTKELEKPLEELGVKEYQNSGSEGLRLMKLVEGRTDIRISEHVNGASTWDLCAPQAIVQAAGGVVMNIDGSKIIYSSQGKLNKRYIAARNEHLANKAIKLCAMLN